MVFGEEIQFLVHDPSDAQSLTELFLRFLGIDQIGIKMKGIFAKLWSKWGNRIIGPNLMSDGHVFRVIDFDYDFGKLWLSPVR